ncbi:hypothetical protein RMATCC62417_03862 [Rhizopus microsporus]|nr:hypothetical protein RMATCC62417_03862 [Rhizopus microsporus]
MALQGAAVAISAELALRCLSPKRNKIPHIRASKFILGLAMALKSCLFLSFHASQWSTCNGTGRAADLFYHIAMAAGNAVLVSRVQAIIPFQYKRIAYIFHWTVTVLRLALGIVDACVIVITNNPDGSCLYADNQYVTHYYWGPVYTLYDTVIDVYVTMMISIILISHIRSLAFDDMRINIILYTSVIYHNVIRTVALTIVNLLSAIFIITKNSNEAIMLVWPIINIVFVCLVGYDSDVTKAIRKIRQRHWRQANSAANIDLGRVPSASQPMPKKRPLSREILNDQQSSLHDDLQSSDSSMSDTEKYEPQKNASTETSTDHTRIGP